MSIWMFVYLLRNFIEMNGKLLGQVKFLINNSFVILIKLLVATILEALIAFFPIKENHDAIGAIDYPLEVRKKYAQNSKKWKCEICGYFNIFNKNYIYNFLFPIFKFKNK